MNTGSFEIPKGQSEPPLLLARPQWTEITFSQPYAEVPKGTVITRDLSKAPVEIILGKLSESGNPLSQSLALLVFSTQTVDASTELTLNNLRAGKQQLGPETPAAVMIAFLPPRERAFYLGQLVLCDREVCELGREAADPLLDPRFMLMVQGCSTLSRRHAAIGFTSDNGRAMLVLKNHEPTFGTYVRPGELPVPPRTRHGTAELSVPTETGDFVTPPGTKQTGGLRIEDLFRKP